MIIPCISIQITFYLYKYILIYPGYKYILIYPGYKYILIYLGYKNILIYPGSPSAVFPPPPCSGDIPFHSSPFPELIYPFNDLQH